MFGMASQEYVDMPDFVLAEFVGRIFYGIFTLLIVIVLLNMLIAMISNSFQRIEVSRTLGFITERNCVQPLNIILYSSDNIVYSWFISADF